MGIMIILQILKGSPMSLQLYFLCNLIKGNILTLHAALI